MKLNLFATCILALAFAGAASAQGTASSQRLTPSTPSAVKAVDAQRAHTRAVHRSCKLLQPAKRNVSAEGSGKTEGVGAADPERHEPRIQVPDACRLGTNYYEYYMHKASEAGMLEAKYHQLAGECPSQRGLTL